MRKKDMCWIRANGMGKNRLIKSEEEKKENMIEETTGFLCVGLKIAI